MSEFCSLARRTLTRFVLEGKRPESLAPLGTRAGCFVSLHDSAGELRGCIGTIEPRRDDLSEEIVENAIAAGTRDPRFMPVEPGELAGLRVEVSVMQPLERIDGAIDLDVKRYGVVVEAGSRRGVLLPDLEGVDTVDRQLAIVKRKARIGAHEPIKLWRFEVEKYDERGS